MTFRGRGRTHEKPGQPAGPASTADGWGPGTGEEGFSSMVRTVSSGFDAEVKRPGRMILQFIKTLLQTQIRQYSLGEEEVKRPAFGILH